MAIDYSQLPLGKPSREDGIRQRRKQKADVVAFEEAEKAKVRVRDGASYCRLVPCCSERHLFETAHVNDKGMGGDHGLRSTADQMLRGCFFHHRGNWSLHSQDLRVEFLTPAKADGPIAMWGRDSTGQWLMLGREIAVGVWERD